MNNWYYNEVEMMNKHKLLNGAGRKLRQAKDAQGGGEPALARRLVVSLGRSLVGAGRGLLDRYEQMPENEVFPQVSKAK